MVQKPASAVSLAELRMRIAAIAGTGAVWGGADDRQARTSLDGGPLDRALPGGGLALGCVHELRMAKSVAEDGAAHGFALALLARIASAAGSVLWCARRRTRPYAQGLAAFGLDPQRFVLAQGRDDRETLWAMEEGLRCPALAAVVGEIGALDLTASRRLQLAAETSGVTGLLLRAKRSSSSDNTPLDNTAAVTCWRVSSAPSHADFATGLGAPRWRVELLRCRGGVPGAWEMEWCHETHRLRMVAPLRDGPDRTPAEIAAETAGERRLGAGAIAAARG